MLKNIKLVGLIIVAGVLAGFSVYFYKNDMNEYIIICGTFICVCIVFIVDDIIGRFTSLKSKSIADENVHNMESNKEEVVEEEEPAEVIEKMISDRNEEEKTVTMEPVHDNDKNNNGIDDQIEAEESSDELEKMLEDRKAEETGNVIDKEETPVSEEEKVEESTEDKEPEVEVDGKDAPVIEEEKAEDKPEVDEEII